MKKGTLLLVALGLFASASFAHEKKAGPETVPKIELKNYVAPTPVIYEISAPVAEITALVPWDEAVTILDHPVFIQERVDPGSTAIRSVASIPINVRNIYNCNVRLRQERQSKYFNYRYWKPTTKTDHRAIKRSHIGIKKE